MKIRQLALTVCAVAVLAGCGSSAATNSSTAVTPTPAPSATPAPTPTVDVKATAATQYLAAANAVNAATIHAPGVVALCKSLSESDIKKCDAMGFTAEEQFLTAVSAITFPTSMVADVSTLISTTTKEAQIRNSLSHETNPGYDTTNENALTTAANDAAAASGVVRHDLGLPPVPA